MREKSVEPEHDYKVDADGHEIMLESNDEHSVSQTYHVW